MSAGAMCSKTWCEKTTSNWYKLGDIALEEAKGEDGVSWLEARSVHAPQFAMRQQAGQAIKKQSAAAANIENGPALQLATEGPQEADDGTVVLVLHSAAALEFARRGRDTDAGGPRGTRLREYADEIHTPGDKFR
jgi:hypothetical protein